MENLSGQMIDKYRLIRQLGTGGMGAVYEAEHTLIGRRCAIKTIHAEHAMKPELTRRMLREARAAAAIGHPNIVETHDFGITEDGRHYLVMELLEGQSLGELLEDSGRLELEVAVAIMWQVLGALEASHDKGIVHRDLKPDNIFVARAPHGGEVVKLLDFGISKFYPDGRELTKLTGTGAVLGTAFYMSPEQAAGAETVDGRADLWSVGVILYEVLTGQRPFNGKNYNAVIIDIVTKKPVPPSRLQSDLSPGLESIILRALEKDREDRFQTASDMRAALRGYLGSMKATTGSLTLPTGLLVTRHEAAARAQQETIAEHGPGFVTGPGDEAPADPRIDRGTAPTVLDESPPSGSGPVAESTTGSGARAEVDAELKKSLGTQPRGEVGPPTGGLLSGAGRRIGVGIGVGVLLLLAVIGAFVLGARSKGTDAPGTKAKAAAAEDVMRGAGERDTPGGAIGARPSTPRPTAEAMASPRVVPMKRPETSASKRVVALRRVGPAGALVFVDGTRQKAPVSLPADGKKHTILVTAKGYWPRRTTFVAKPGARPLEITLRRKRARARPMKGMGGFYGNPFGM